MWTATIWEIPGNTVAILKTEALTRYFGALKAVDALSVTVEAGEVFGLLGPNGAGKTTVIKMLTTLLPPTSGSASVGGFDVVRRAGDVRRIIGYVPQMLSADGTLTGYENLLIFAKLYDLPRAERKPRVQSALELMGLTEAADKLVRTYSGGMIRRLEIAQSMLHEPKVLFLDEPTIGLDPLARQAVWDRMGQLRTDFGTTILLTTHYMDEADDLCDRVAIMHQGVVRVIGAPEELKKGLGGNGATLEQVFAHYAGASITAESGGGYRETSRTRRVARRLG
jgi:ABC-2 type transport system ATP-binding protein